MLINFLKLLFAIAFLSACSAQIVDGEEEETSGDNAASNPIVQSTTESATSENTSDTDDDSSSVVDNTAPENITAFTAATGATLGIVTFTLDFPDDASDYAAVYIMYATNTSTAPSNCNSGTRQNISTIGDGTVNIANTPDQDIAGRLCLEDDAGNVNEDMTATATAQNIQRIFVSSATFDADLTQDYMSINGGVFANAHDGGNARCQYLAENASTPLTGTWEAFIGTSSKAGTAYSSFGQLRNLNGDTLYTSLTNALSDETLSIAVTYDENGTDNGVDDVWVGMNADGSVTTNCSDFSSTASSGHLGTYNESSDEWILANVYTCNTSAQIYCLEVSGASP